MCKSHTFVTLVQHNHMQIESLESDLALITTKPTGGREKRLALCALALSALFCSMTLPFVKVHLAEIPAFIPAYVSVLIICDLITSILLFSHYSVTRLPVSTIA